MTHLEATAIQVILASRPVLFLASYISPSRPLIRAGLTACFGGGLLLLIAGDLNAKHVDWNPRLTTRRGIILRDYADINSSLIFVPDTPATNPYNPFATPDVLDIVITNNLQFPVYLTSYSELSSDHLRVLIDTVCRPSCHHPPDGADFRRTDWAKFRTYSEDQIPFDPDLNNETAIDTFVENFSGGIHSQLSPA
jgi:hypothetical protein